ncbi:MAG: hypothetical protein U0531_09290 [Dehalococcoidia bacterium]
MTGPWYILHAAPTTTGHTSLDILMLFAPFVVAGALIFGPRLAARLRPPAEDTPAGRPVTAARRDRHGDEPI